MAVITIAGSAVKHSTDTESGGAVTAAAPRACHTHNACASSTASATTERL